MYEEYFPSTDIETAPTFIAREFLLLTFLLFSFSCFPIFFHSFYNFPFDLLLAIFPLIFFCFSSNFFIFSPTFLGFVHTILPRTVFPPSHPFFSLFLFISVLFCLVFHCSWISLFIFGF